MINPDIRTKFTFHNVSINSDKKAMLVASKAYLHSIMYLLIRVARTENPTLFF